MKNKILLPLFISVAMVSCGDEKPQQSTTSEAPTVEKDIAVNTNTNTEAIEMAKMYFGVIPDEMISQDNEITPEKVALGKALYYDVRLSLDNTISCNSCHNLDTYGVDNLSFSPGNDGGLGGRNSPTTLNAAIHISQFWDGREPDVEAQAGGPVLNPDEMAMPNEEFVIDRLSDIDEYVDMFEAAFPESPEVFTYENMRKAIGAFERKLSTPGRIDDFINGNGNALSEDEIKGMETFVEVGCITCHSSAGFGGNMYQKFGVYGDYWTMTGSKNHDNGRFDVTAKEADRYVFKTPSLRNVVKTGPYFHDGSVSSLTDAIRIMGKLQLNKDMTDEQIQQIELFMNTLTGEVPEELKM